MRFDWSTLLPTAVVLWNPYNLTDESPKSPDHLRTALQHRPPAPAADASQVHRSTPALQSSCLLESLWCSLTTSQ